MTVEGQESEQKIKTTMTYNEFKEIISAKFPEVTSDQMEKFRKMEKYYTHIVPAKGEGHYKHVNLKFKGQIVCKEK